MIKSENKFNLSFDDIVWAYAGFDAEEMLEDIDFIDEDEQENYANAFNKFFQNLDCFSGTAESTDLFVEKVQEKFEDITNIEFEGDYADEFKCFHTEFLCSSILSKIMTAILRIKNM